MPSFCPPVRNSRGQTSDAPCSEGWCSPLDVTAWYDAARQELDLLDSMRSRMVQAEHDAADELRKRWDAVSVFAPISSMATFQLTEAATSAATIAHEARCQRFSIAAREAAPVPSAEPTPAPSDGGSFWPSLPGIPDISPPDFGKAIAWLLILGALFFFGGRERRRE